MMYLLKGDDYQAKEQKLDELRNKILSSPDARRFDYDNLDATKLSPEDLKKSFLTLPVVNKQRLIIIRHIQKTSAQNQNIILDFLKTNSKDCILIADCSEMSQKGFLDKLEKSATVLTFGGRKKLSVFDMKMSIGSGNSREALNVLSALINEGNHPLQLMGGVVWIWGDQKKRISSANFQQGLKELKEADLNMKRSRLPPEYALEVLITKLCLLAV
ncbi:MAG: hypothetical protein KBD53_00850 [Candidatus Omnitrophica bacterium]|nr:hypothetical protein [Candidatus Omnitrophota bacterium]